MEYVACFNQKGILTSAVGAFVLGVGMTLSGAVSISFVLRVFFEMSFLVHYRLNLVNCLSFEFDKNKSIHNS